MIASSGVHVPEVPNLWNVSCPRLSFNTTGPPAVPTPSSLVPLLRLDIIFTLFLQQVCFDPGSAMQRRNDVKMMSSRSLHPIFAGMSLISGTCPTLANISTGRFLCWYNSMCLFGFWDISLQICITNWMPLFIVGTHYVLWIWVKALD